MSDLLFFISPMLIIAVLGLVVFLVFSKSLTRRYYRNMFREALKDPLIQAMLYDAMMQEAQRRKKP